MSVGQGALRDDTREDGWVVVADFAIDSKVRMTLRGSYRVRCLKLAAVHLPSFLLFSPLI